MRGDTFAMLLWFGWSCLVFVCAFAVFIPWFALKGELRWRVSGA